MWVLLSRRLRVLLFFALAAPLIAWLLGKVSDRLEARHGHPTRTSALLARVTRWLRRKSRGPLAHHDQPDRNHEQGRGNLRDPRHGPRHDSRSRWQVRRDR